MTPGSNFHAPTAHEQADSSAGWSNRLAFVLAAAGSAVGLGNVWKFPYITGENGGGAFVLVYLACITLIGLPILVAEIVIGRRGKANPIYTFEVLAKKQNHSRHWSLIGWMGLLSAFLILSFYSVVAGWALTYLGYAIAGNFTTDPADTVALAERIGTLFNNLLANPGILLLGHTAIMAVTIFIVTRGIRGGVEKAVRILMPGLLLLIVGLVIYAALSTGQFGRGFAFMFSPDWTKLSWEAVLIAMGHAFFTLSVGMTAMMAYGSFLNKDVSIGKASFAIAGLDTFIALLAGLAIFPIVFAHGLEPGSGPGLIFVTLPIAFSEVPGGSVVAMFFFLFLTLAALTSTISILEPVVEYLEYRRRWKRPVATLVTGLSIWLLGIGCALSFNYWSSFTPFGKNLFDLFDYLTSNLLLPLGGLLIAIYTGYVLTRETLSDELGSDQSLWFKGWIFLLRFVAPIGVGLVLVYNLI